MNYTTHKTYRIDWASVWKSIEAIMFGMFLGFCIALMFFFSIPEAKAFNLLGAYAAMGVENKQVKLERKKRDKPKRVDVAPQTGNEQCVGGYVIWADGTISKCEVVK